MASPIDIVVDEDRCTGCGLCVTYCPYGAAAVEEDVAVIDEACLRCTACLALCPVGALTVERAPPRRGPRPDPRWPEGTAPRAPGRG